MHDVLVASDPVKLLREELRAGGAGDRPQGITASEAVGKRLANGHWAVDELAVRGDECHVEALGSELCERQGNLQGSDSAADDDDPEVPGWGCH